MKFFIYFFLLLVINIKSQSVDFGDYVYWDKIKYDLINNPNLKILDLETGLTWMITVVNKNVVKS